jgi:zinc transporter ZupT
MTKKTAMFIGFLLSTSAIIVMVVFLMMKDKSNMKPMLFIGIGLALGSLVLRNLLRFKPEWFKDGQDNK